MADRFITLSDATGNTRRFRTFDNGDGNYALAVADAPRSVSHGVAGIQVASGDMTTPAALVTAPAAGLKLVVVGVEISTDTAMRFDITEETAGTVLASFYLAANTTIQWKPIGRLKLSTAVKRLMGTASIAGNVRVHAYYTTEA